MKEHQPRLPPWAATNERQQREMFDWVKSELNKLDKIDDEEAMKLELDWLNRKKNYHKNRVRAHRQWLEHHGPQIFRAKLLGDIEPLRKALPHLAEFLHLPKRRRGQRFRKPKKKIDDPVQMAVNDVRRIRELWQKNYGKKNRIGLSPTAEEIAADRWDRWGVTVDQIVNRLKKSPAK